MEVSWLHRFPSCGSSDFRAFLGYFCCIFYVFGSFYSEVFTFRFLCWDHGYMPYASLCLILTPQTPDLALDLRISGCSLALFMSSVCDRFPVFQLV
jgi:hypothetical protein